MRMLARLLTDMAVGMGYGTAWTSRPFTIRRRQGDLAGAEEAYLRLLSVEPDHLQIRQPLMCCARSKAAPVESGPICRLKGIKSSRYWAAG